MQLLFQIRQPGVHFKNKFYYNMSSLILQSHFLLTHYRLFSEIKCSLVGRIPEKFDRIDQISKLCVKGLVFLLPYFTLLERSAEGFSMYLQNIQAMRKQTNVANIKS